jgi:hypothetical protein
MVYCRLSLDYDFQRLTAAPWPTEHTRHRVSLSSDALWTEAMKFGEAEMKSGVSGRDLIAIAGRSAEFDAANKLLNSGSKLENIGFTEPVLLWPASGPAF